MITVIALQTHTGTIAYAAGGIAITDEFDGLNGDGKYLGSSYRDNYQLDVEKLGALDMVDKAFNSLANIIFSFITTFGFTTSAIFYYCMKFDIAALIQPLLDPMQSTLHESLFMPLLNVVLIGTAVLAIGRFARRDFVGLIEEFGKVIFIVVLSVLIVRDASTAFSYATGITKSVSISVLTGVSGKDVGSNVDDYAASAAGILWVSLVHEPWKALEFGSYQYTDEDVEKLLKATDADERQEIVNDIQDKDRKAFSKTSSILRIGQGSIILLTMLIKCVIYILIALLQLVFQLVAVFYVIIAPLILLLSLVPGYNFDLLGTWARKILETQIGVLLITFLMGIVVLIDGLLQNLSSEFGWFIVLILQIACSTALYLFRGKFFGIVSGMHRRVQNPAIIKSQLERSGNPYPTMRRAGRKAEKMYDIAEKRVAAVYGVASDEVKYQFEDKVAPRLRSALPYLYTTEGKFKVTDKIERIQEEKKARKEEKLRKKKEKRQKRRKHHRSTGSGRTARTRKGPPLSKVKKNNKSSSYQAESGIKGITYYAPSEVSDNWHELWNQSVKVKRPETNEEDNDKKAARASKGPPLSKVKKNNESSSYQAESGIKGITYYAPSEVSDNWHELWNQSVKVKRPETNEEDNNKKAARASKGPQKDTKTGGGYKTSTNTEKCPQKAIHKELEVSKDLYESLTCQTSSKRPEGKKNTQDKEKKKRRPKTTELDRSTEVKIK